ncbi:YhcH/YjgK/YiaL family protein [Muricauda sp. ANG21]|uniref:YhcH/YjgK/YiaL family protein n=1 Tax=Allomuricauda sp. ANG21 TaxID=3042468 RepID=UPI003453EC87
MNKILGTNLYSRSIMMNLMEPFAKRVPILILFVLCSIGTNSQSIGTPCNKENVSDWYKSKVWLGGLQLKPHKSIDKEELARQYCENSNWWDQAFEFLNSHNLEDLETGRYIIDEGNVMAYVSEGPTKDIGEIEWETHQNFNDLQYVVKGKAGMGVASLNNAEYSSTVAYNPKRDVENYNVENGKFYVAKPGTFFIFSPRDIHRPAFRKKGHDTIKKILIKVRVP